MAPSNMAQAKRAPLGVLLSPSLLLFTTTTSLLLAPAAAAYAYNPSLPLHPTELESLLQFKAAIFDDDGLLSTWTGDDSNDSSSSSNHPCDWEGVDCDCEKLYPLPVDPHPCPDNDNEDGNGLFNHVYRLDFGPRKPSNKRLHGVYSPYLGNLTEVRQFYLHVNKFEGTIPTEFGRLQKLQRLIIRDNVLTGNVPEELGSSLGIKDLYFDNNLLSGSLPNSLCDIVNQPDSVLNVVQPSNNPLLCGEVPQCLYGKYLNPLHVVGTHLIYPPAEDSSTRVSGYCSTVPPKCDVQNGCYVEAPAVISSLSTFDFGFTNFTDPIGMRSYSWCIGTELGICDAQALVPYTFLRQKEETQLMERLRLLEEENNTTNTNTNTSQASLLNPATYTARGVSLMNGGKYYVTIVGENMAGPPLRNNVSSLMILADNTPPVPNEIKPVAECSDSSSGDQLDTTRVSLCWEAFSEPESFVNTYQVGLEDREGNVITEPIDIGNITSFTLRNLELVVGNEYVGVVHAKNAAGLSGAGRSLSLRIVSPASDSSPNLAWAVTLGLLVPVLAIIGFLSYRTKQRLIERVRRDEWRAGNALRLEELRSGSGSSSAHNRRGSFVSNGTQDAMSPNDEDMMEQEQDILFGNVSKGSIFFVFTDIEDSTAISQTNPSAHQVIQQVHDGLMRQCIDDNSGYEINTQGDAFEIAFSSSHSAAKFCLDVQSRLLRIKWSKAVLKLHACRQEVNDEGAIIFAGPRVRMGIHKSSKGGITRRIHDLTKHVVFGGPEYLLGRAIGDVAYGGQIVCSEGAALDILQAMRMSDYPNLKLLGEYNLNENATQIPIYQLSPTWGSMDPRRSYSLHLMGAERHAVQSTYRVMTRPIIADDDKLAICLLRINEYGILKESSTALELVEEIIACQAQNFDGYIETISEEYSNLRLVTFNDPSLALQFSMMVHASFLYASWENHVNGFNSISPFDSEYDQSGALIWRGPRLAMVIDRVDFSDVKEGDDLSKSTALTLPFNLIKYINVGQTVLTDEVWQSLHMRPTRCSFVSLGTMMFNGINGPISLIQALPKILQGRTFGVIPCERYLSPGYSQAPKPSDGVAIVFCAPSGLGDDNNNGLSADDRSTILRHWTALCRREVDRMHGYECKEVDGGKFLFAFQTYPEAIAFASSVQVMLRKNSSWILPHMERALESPHLLVSIGMAYGMQLFRKPQRASGRADYFGVIPNLAARVTSQAKPGQSLLCVVSDEGVMDFAGWSQDGQGAKFRYSEEEVIRITNVGVVKLKGFDFTPMLAQISSDEAGPEDFGKPKGWISDKLITQGLKSKRMSVSCKSTATDIMGRTSRYSSDLSLESCSQLSTTTARKSLRLSSTESRRSSETFSVDGDPVDETFPSEASLIDTSGRQSQYAHPTIMEETSFCVDH